MRDNQNKGFADHSLLVELGLICAQYIVFMPFWGLAKISDHPITEISAALLSLSFIAIPITCHLIGTDKAKDFQYKFQGISLTIGAISFGLLIAVAIWRLVINN